jgi:teichuronic acid biosynthesis glycosyltransferase TuaC
VKVLFISSGNSKNGISPIVKNQGDSLVNLRQEVKYFTIQGKGIKGYLRSVFLLRSYLKNNVFDVVHAHYSLSAFVATLANAQPLVVSLMGSDVKAAKFTKMLITFCTKFFWKKVIVKSQDMKISSGLSDVFIVPNGVDLLKFKSIDKAEALTVTKWDKTQMNILFLANPTRKEKNFTLAKASFDLLNTTNKALYTLTDVPNHLVPYYINAADVVLLTSLWEGSPNVIKESMACNVPIVTTPVGDVRYLVNNVDGCYITSYDPNDVAEKLNLAIDYSQKKIKTQGRNHLVSIGLDAENVASKIINIYNSVIQK